MVAPQWRAIHFRVLSSQGSGAKKNKKEEKKKN